MGYYVTHLRPILQDVLEIWILNQYPFDKYTGKITSTSSGGQWVDILFSWYKEPQQFNLRFNVFHCWYPTRTINHFWHSNRTRYIQALFVTCWILQTRAVQKRNMISLHDVLHNDDVKFTFEATVKMNWYSRSLLVSSLFVLSTNTCAITYSYASSVFPSVQKYFPRVFELLFNKLGYRGTVPSPPMAQ